MPRLFVAAWPTSVMSERLAALPRDDAPGVRMVPAANWHVTLRFVGEEDASTVTERLRGVALPRATATVGPALRRLGGQVVAPVDGVDALAHCVTEATRDLGEPPRDRFVGHLTVARLRRGVSSSLVGVAIDGSFDVDEVALVASELTSDGAVYTTLERFATGRT